MSESSSPQKKEEKIIVLTVMGFGSKIRVINILALKESHGGQVNSAKEIWISDKRNDETEMIEKTV